MTIYRELSVKEVKTMNKVLFIVIALCGTIYPTISFLGYLVFKGEPEIVNSNFTKIYMKKVGGGSIFFIVI